MTFWIGVACANHVAVGVAGGFAQLGHGKHVAVKALKSGDWLAFYSPTTELGGGDKVQGFTALGQVISDAPYHATQSDTFQPWRVDVEFRKEAKFASIRPLLDQLDLTKDRGPRWGMAVRTSRIKPTIEDGQRIAAAMGVIIDA